MPSTLLKTGLKQITFPFHPYHTLTKRGLTTLPKVYTTEIESKIYEKWEESVAFQPNESAKSGKFSMILPPPNVTGNLHLGHALTVTLQDMIVRHQRMCGKQVLWVPGIDHAGIATQVIVEKELSHILRKTRLQIGREEFIDHVWKWKNDKGDHISKQLRKLGASLDWSKEFFTLDKTQSYSVNQALFNLWNKKLIYRDETLVNWSCNLQSTVSDIEIDHITVEGPTKISVPDFDTPVVFGEMTNFAYKIVDSDEEIVVSTTRIETMLGDVAVAVHPDDQRYTKFIGSQLIHPFTGISIPVIADESVDPEFGTGAVKVTPSHDKSDFNIGKNHDLPFRTVIDEQGFMNGVCGEFSGMHRFEVREEITKALEEKGLLRSVKPHNLQVPICSRTGDVIEYMIKPQWFLKCKAMAERAADVVRNNELIIEPEKYHKIWFTWLDGIKDWCISRQLWWGHQMPFYLCRNDENSFWVAASSESEAISQAEENLTGEIEVRRDPDVLDTWFSSSLLPFSSLGWFNNDKSLQRFYPLDTMVTGHDILFFWVARMTMIGLELTDRLPFKKVLLHSIVCDSQGRKMSKSLGNVIDPIDVIRGCELKKLKDEISENKLRGKISEEECKKALEFVQVSFPDGIPNCGTDALRYTLISHNVKNMFINFSLDDCKANKSFCNKIWQATNFTCDWAEKFQIKDYSCEKPPDKENLNEMDQWILSQLYKMVDVMHNSFETSDFHMMTISLRSFLYSDLCDVYIESVKPLFQKKKSAENSCLILIHCLDVAFRCLSPIMPFITELLYSRLPNRKNGSVTNASYPERFKYGSETLNEKVDLVKNIISGVRKMKLENHVTNKANVLIVSGEAYKITNLLYVIEALAKCVVKVADDIPSNQNVIKEIISEQTDVYLVLLPDSNAKEMKPLDSSILTQKVKKLEKTLDKLLEMTSTTGYKEKVAENIKQAHSLKINKIKQELVKLRG